MHRNMIRGTVPADARHAWQPESLDASGVSPLADNGYVIHKAHLNPCAGPDMHAKVMVVAGLPLEFAPKGGGRDGRRRGLGAQNALGENCIGCCAPGKVGAKNDALVVTIASSHQFTVLANPNLERDSANLNCPRRQPLKLAQLRACPSLPSVIAGLARTDGLFNMRRRALPKSSSRQAATCDSIDCAKTRIV